MKFQGISRAHTETHARTHAPTHARTHTHTHARTRTLEPHHLWAHRNPRPHAGMDVRGHARGQVRAHAHMRSRKAPSLDITINCTRTHTCTRARTPARTHVRTRTLESHHLWAHHNPRPHARMGVRGHARGQMRAHALVRSRKVPTSAQHAQSRRGPNQLAMQLARVRTVHNQ